MTDGSATNDTTPTISGTADPGVQVEVFVDGTSVGTTTSTLQGGFAVTPATALDAGPHVEHHTASDEVLRWHRVDRGATPAYVARRIDVGAGL